MTASTFRRLACIGLVALVASGPAEADDGISQEARSLITRGDMAYTRVEDLRARAQALGARIERAGTETAPDAQAGRTAQSDTGAGSGLATRSAPGREPGADGPEDRDALEAELSRTMIKLRWFEDHTRDLWERAVAIDPDAQDLILQRLRGSGLKS